MGVRGGRGGGCKGEAGVWIEGGRRGKGREKKRHGWRNGRVREGGQEMIGVRGRVAREGKAWQR